MKDHSPKERNLIDGFIMTNLVIQLLRDINQDVLEVYVKMEVEHLRLLKVLVVIMEVLDNGYLILLNK